MLGKYQSGQMGQTVNLLAYAFGGSNPSLPTENQIVIERGCLIFCFTYRFVLMVSSIVLSSDFYRLN